ncbi:MAG TPA: YcaO-like family protein [Candidatus Paceibacterota bacterium]
MLLEETLQHQPFLAFPPYINRSKREALAELGRPCSRFKNPLGIEERLGLFLAGKMSNVDLLDNVTQVIASGVPLNWQAILRYLEKKNVVVSPNFRFAKSNNDLPKFWQIGLETNRERDTDGLDVKGGGFSHSHSVETAMSKSVGEALERHFLTLYRNEKLPRMTSTEMRAAGSPVLDVSEQSTFLPWQVEANPRLHVSPSSPFSWVTAERMDGGVVHVPAQMVFWNYDFSRDMEEPVLLNTTTSGAGGHFTKKEAVLSGLLELIERDGFLIYWLNGIAPNRIDARSARNTELFKFLAATERYGLEAHFLDITSDIGIPTALCVIIDPRANDPVLAMGASAGIDAEGNMLHAGYEALAVLTTSLQLEQFRLPKEYKPFSDKKIGRSERLSLWRGKDMLERFAFFLQGRAVSIETFARTIQVDDSAEAHLAYVLGKLKEKGAGYEVYVYEVQHEVLRELGYHVVKTIVPRLIPLYLFEHLPALGATRLREAARTLGYTPAEHFVPWPHPFP